MKKLTCPLCGTELPEDSFYVDRTVNSGRRKLCIPCYNLKSTAYRRSIHGVITQIWHNQKVNSRVRNHPEPSYTKSELAGWIFRQKEWEKLYGEWVKSGFRPELSVSVDRIDSRLPYTLDNIRLGTFKENLLNENIEMRQGKIGRGRPVIGITETGKEIVFLSASIASRETGLQKTHISACARGERNSTGGYKWRYIC